MADPRPSRPNFAAGYGIAPDLPDPPPLPWDQARRWLAEARNYWVVTAGPDGLPHAAPVWAVWLDDALLFSTDPASRKARNLAASPEVIVHLESGDEVVILEGAIEEATDPELRRRFAGVYDEKYAYRPDAESSLIYLLRPRAAFTWLERDYPNTATRWTF